MGNNRAIPTDEIGFGLFVLRVALVALVAALVMISGGLLIRLLLTGAIVVLSKAVLPILILVVGAVGVYILFCRGRILYRKYERKEVTPYQ